MSAEACLSCFVLILFLMNLQFLFFSLRAHKIGAILPSLVFDGMVTHRDSFQKRCAYADFASALEIRAISSRLTFEGNIIYKEFMSAAQTLLKPLKLELFQQN